MNSSSSTHHTHKVHEQVTLVLNMGEWAGLWLLGCLVFLGIHHYIPILIPAGLAALMALYFFYKALHNYPDNPGNQRLYRYGFVVMGLALILAAADFYLSSHRVVHIISVWIMIFIIFFFFKHQIRRPEDRQNYWRMLTALLLAHFILIMTF